MVIDRILIGVGIALALYILLRYWRTIALREGEVQKEVKHILESDEHKVRGRFE